MATTFSNKVAILNNLWLNHRFDKNLSDFIYYNDLGLPFANSISEGNELTPEMEIAIEDTFDSLLKEFNISDKGFDNINQILSLA